MKDDNLLMQCEREASWSAAHLCRFSIEQPTIGKPTISIHLFVSLFHRPRMNIL